MLIKLEHSAHVKAALICELATASPHVDTLAQLFGKRVKNKWNQLSLVHG